MECSAMELRSDTKLYGNIIVAKGAGALINSSLYKTMQRPRTDDDRYISCTKKRQLATHAWTMHARHTDVMNLQKKNRWLTVIGCLSLKKGCLTTFRISSGDWLVHNGKFEHGPLYPVIRKSKDKIEWLARQAVCGTLAVSVPSFPFFHELVSLLFFGGGSSPMASQWKKINGQNTSETTRLCLGKEGLKWIEVHWRD